jgi:Alpha/beta hydrolase domain
LALVHPASYRDQKKAEWIQYCVHLVYSLSRPSQRSAAHSVGSSFSGTFTGDRITYVDVPVKSFHVPNEGAEPRIAAPSHFIAARRLPGQDPDAQLCGLSNFETALSRDQLKKLYKSPRNYYNKVAQRYDELAKEGWALPVYRDLVLGEAARVTF